MDGQTRTHTIHHGLDLGETTTFPFIVFFVPSHGVALKCHFVPRLPSGSFEIPKIETLATLKAHNFVCRSLVEVRSETKL
jgi:hypothetical protein